MDPDLAGLGRRIAAARDRDAEEALARALLPRIRVFGIRYLRNEAEAEDFAQDAILVVLAALRAGRVNDVGQIPAFALATCRNLIQDRSRTAKRRSELLDRHDRALLPTSFAPPDHAPLDPTHLARCLATLDDRERRVIELTFWEERSAAEVAAALGLTAGNVRVIRHRAIERLQRCLFGQEVSP